MQLIKNWKAALFIGSALLTSCTLHGQAVYGSLYGTITDTTGAVVPNATITVTDVEKGTTVTVTANGSGDYTVDHLIPDTYNLKVEAAGFKGFEATAIPVFADQSPKVDAALQAGGADQTVTVNADSIPSLKTDRADVSTTFAGKEIQDLPIPDRNFTNLQLLLPGAQQLGWSHAADENPQGSKQIQVDGQAFGGVAFELDGTDNQDPILGIIVINPNIDSLSESKITTQNFDAEFGKAVSSVVTAQTKSGTNSFHGSAFDYRESTANLARDPFTQANGSASAFPPGLKNQFGGSVGGPILKDKVFFFGDYQGVRQKVGFSETQSVPSANLISTCLGQSTSFGIAGCDFSQYVAAGATTAIYNPVTGAAYPHNVIPASQLSAPALNLLKELQKYTPNNNGGKYPGLINNYSAGGSGLFNSNQYDFRGDEQVNDKVHVFGRFSRFTDTLSGAQLFGAAGGSGFGLGGYGGLSTGANDSLALGTDIAVNPKLVTDIRLGYYRYNIADQKNDQGTNVATNLGIPGLNLGTKVTGGSPSFNIADAGTFGGPNNGTASGSQYGDGLNVSRCNCPLTEREDQFQIVNNWTKFIGNHAVKFGADIRYARNLRVPSDNDRTGVLQFGTGPTSDGTGDSTGLGYATFVLGNVTNFNRYVSSSTNAKEFQKRDFFYVQDTWRATEKLTLNLGLRYELYFPEVVNGKGNGALMNLQTGYLQVAGYGGIGTNMNWQKPANPYNPRIGLAYQLNPATVIRAGYGRSFDIGVFGSIFGHTVTQDLPVLANQQISTTGGPTADAFSLTTGPSANVFPAVPANGLLPNPGYSVDSHTRPTTLRLPTIDAWNLSVQRSLTPSLTTTLAYVGNKGTHTLSAGDGNDTNPNEAGIVLPAQYSITGQSLHYDPNVSSTQVSLFNGAVFQGIAPDGGTANQTYLGRYYGAKLPACSDPAYARPTLAGVGPGMCGWTNGIQLSGDDQNTHFNALQATLAKQAGHGLTLNVNYAWQRGFNYSTTYATWDKRVAYGRDDSIREQQVVGYGTYELPFGRNKMFLSQANTIVNEAVNGWQFSPVINYSSGLPFTLSYNECAQSIPGSAPCYVNGNPSGLKTKIVGFPGGPNGLSFYNAVSSNIKTNPAGGFSAPGLDTIGNSGRNSIYGPHFFNGDLSLQKNFPIRESILAQFRVDAYNGFNHINFNTPGGNIESTGSISSGPGPGGTSNPRQLQFSLRMQF